MESLGRKGDNVLLSTTYIRRDPEPQDIDMCFSSTFGVSWGDFLWDLALGF